MTRIRNQGDEVLQLRFQCRDVTDSPLSGWDVSLRASLDVDTIMRDAKTGAALNAIKR